MIISTPDICVVRNNNTYKSQSFTKFCGKHIGKSKQLITIFTQLAMYGHYCPTIYVNTLAENITLKYEEKEEIIYVVIGNEVVKYHNSNHTLYSNNELINIKKVIKDFLR